MNPDQLFGILRTGIPPLAAAIANWGIGTSVQNTATITAIAWGLVSAWSWYSNTDKSKILAINANDNGVHVVPSTVAQGSTVDGPIVKADPKPYSP